MRQKVLTLFSEEDLTAMRSGQIFEAPGLNGQEMLFGFDKSTGEIQATTRLALPAPKERRKKKKYSRQLHVKLAQQRAEGKRRRFPLSFKQMVVNRIKTGEKVVNLSEEYHIVRSVLDGWVKGRGMVRDVKGATA